MTPRSIRLILILLASASFASCELVADIFTAGIWVGVILVLLLVLLIWGITRLFR